MEEPVDAALVESLLGLKRQMGVSGIRVGLVSALPRGLEVVATVTLCERGPRIVVDLAPSRPAPTWPPGDARHPYAGRCLNATEVGRHASWWLRSRDEVLGLVELGSATVSTSSNGTRREPALGPLVGAVQALWRELDERVGDGAVAVLTEKGSLEATCARGRELLGPGHLARLRAALDSGRLPETMLLGPMLAELVALNGARKKRFLVRMSRAPRLRVAPELLLSSRQREVALLAAKGMSASEIARALEVAEPTVKTHMVQVYRVLGVENRIELHERLLHLL